MAHQVRSALRAIDALEPTRVDPAVPATAHSGGLLQAVLLAPEVWGPYLLSRALLLALCAVAPAIQAGLRVDVDVPWPPFDAWSSSVFWVLFSGDSGWYQSIVTSGYHRVPLDGGQANWAFFPAYPLAVRALGGGHWTGILLSSIVAIPALGLVRQLVDELRGPELARRAVALICFFPASWVLSAYRPESLFLLFTAGACLAARRRSFPLACGLAALATITRPQGLFALIPILWEQRRAGGPLLARETLAFLLPPLALAAFSAHIWSVTGDPLAWSRVQGAWGRAAQSPLSVLWEAAVGNPRIIGYWGWDLTALNVAIWIGALLGAVSLLRAPDLRGLAAYAALAVLMPLSSGSTSGGARYVLPLFPLFLAWAGAKERRWTYEALLAAFALVFGACVVWLSAGSHAVMT